MIKKAGPRSREPASDLRKLVGDTGIEPVTSSVSRLHRSRSSRAKILAPEQFAALYGRVITEEAEALRTALEDLSSAPQHGCPWRQDEETPSWYNIGSSVTHNVCSGAGRRRLSPG
jgi:hypothetical protein